MLEEWERKKLGEILDKIVELDEIYFIIWFQKKFPKIAECVKYGKPVKK